MPNLQRLLPTGTGTFANRELWVTLAHVDLASRYRGSLLGPLWITMATGVLVAGIGLLYGGLFGQPLDQYLPYIAVSIVLWTLISTTLLEAAPLFPGEGAILKQMPVPASMFVTRLIYRNILVSGHNLLIVAFVLIIFPPSLSWTLLAVPLGVVLLLVNLWWVAMVLSVLGARYRDVPPIIASVVQIFFFLTPVIWRAEDLPDRAAFIYLNPVYHLLEIVRAPIILGSIPWMSLAICAVTALFGTFAALHVLSWSRTRLVYWL